MLKESVKHVILKYSDKLAPPKQSAILLHNQVIKEKGYVWIGKFGRPISNGNIDLLKKQVDSKKPTYIFLVQKSKKEYQVTIGSLASVSKTLTKEELSKVPDYYSSNVKNVGTWFKIKKFYSVDSAVLRKIFVVSSGAAAISTLPWSMAGFFIVRLDAPSLGEYNKKEL